MQDRGRDADQGKVMRLARPILVVLFLLAIAPAASAHDDAQPDHRDTGAQLAGADINRALAVAGMARTVAPDLPQFLPTTWCGSERTTDNTANAAFPSGAAQIKVVYAHANDQADKFATWRDALQTDVSRIEQYLALQTGGRRALRFDMGNECGPQYVDIQVVHLTHSRSYYSDGVYGSAYDFDHLASEVQLALGPAAGPRDVFVLAEGLTDEADEWGIAEVQPDDRADAGNVSNAGGLTATMWTKPGTAPAPYGWQPTVILHEITHNLGGVQQSSPHHTSGWHCIDGQDVMCYPDGSPQAASYNPNVCPQAAAAIPQTYDCGHDDYFNPDPAAGSYLDSHWNVYGSVFMAACANLGTACGDNIVPTVPVNTALPTVSGSTQPGAVLTASAGTWLNRPTTYTLQWQRAAGADWASVPGAIGPNYVATAADAGVALRVAVTASNADGSAIVASAPTAPVTAIAPPLIPAPKPVAPIRLRITLRDHLRHAKGTLAATVVAVAAGREVRTKAAKVTVTAGTWRLRLCAGTKTGRLRCTLTRRVRTRTRSARLPAARVVVPSAKGALRVTAALVDRRLRVRARGSAASA
jgi:hypothetical protein